MLQASTALSNPPATADANMVAVEQTVPLSQLEQSLQAMRAVVQAQHTQLQSLQTLRQSQPLVGLTTDQPWGMALEGLSLGLAALLVGAVVLLVLRTLPWARREQPAEPAPSPMAAAPEFSDSMLYLADQDDVQEVPPSVPTNLHDPQHDAKASTLAHEDGDPALEYHRTALAAQGLSVIAGAGRIDSERMPLSPPPMPEKESIAIFSPSLSNAEFDQRAAAEEVERVRRYLAQRRADRAQTAGAWEPDSLFAENSTLPSLAQREARIAQTLADTGAAPLTQVDIHLEMGAPTESGFEPSSYRPLSEGASLLAALSEDVHESAVPAAPLDDGTEGDDAPPSLPSAHVQLALAQEFRDLGLWDEARARLLEVLEQPDIGQHAQAQALLDELQQLAPASALTPLWDKGTGQ